MGQKWERKTCGLVEEEIEPRYSFLPFGFHSRDRRLASVICSGVIFFF